MRLVCGDELVQLRLRVVVLEGEISAEHLLHRIQRPVLTWVALWEVVVIVRWDGVVRREMDLYVME